MDREQLTVWWCLTTWSSPKSLIFITLFKTILHSKPGLPVLCCNCLWQVNTNNQSISSQVHCSVPEVCHSPSPRLCPQGAAKHSTPEGQESPVSSFSLPMASKLKNSSSVLLPGHNLSCCHCNRFWPSCTVWLVLLGELFRH